MSREFHSHESSLSIEAQERIAEQLIRYSRALTSGERPEIEAFLTGFAGAERAEFLRELVLQEIEYRGEKGELVSFEEYRKQFPDDQAALDKAENQFRNEATRLDRDRDPAQPGERLHYVGNYELLEEIGRGGMGVVYRARQLGLGRIVAVKMLLNSQLATDTDITRFEREAKLAARLQHPHIVVVHEVGRHKGFPYFSMDLVEGQSLAKVVRERPLPPKQAARYVQMAAQAVHQAHEVGILHRDIKPSNILIDKDDQVRITDFGLAKEVDADHSLTDTGSILGTASYMPPEQAEGNRAKIGVCSDVYSLGAVLYELLTSRPPFAAATVWETLLQVKTREPVSPRALNPNVPRDLETICLKCLSKEPARRYASANEFANDLERWLNNEPIVARPVGRLERMWLWSRRRPVLASTLALSLLIVVGLTTYVMTRPAYLNVRITPADARVTVNGEPITVRNGGARVVRDPGRVTVSAIAAGHRREFRDIILVRGIENTADVDLRLIPQFGYFVVNTAPTGSRIDVFDEAGNFVTKGTTPFNSPRLPTGVYQLNISQDLFSPVEQRVSVLDGDRLTSLDDIVLSGKDANIPLLQLRQWKQILSIPIQTPKKYVEVPLAEFLGEIFAGTQVSFTINHQELAEERLADLKITTSTDAGPLLEALDQLEGKYGIAAIPNGDPEGRQVLITTSYDAEDRFQTIVYPVADLKQTTDNLRTLPDHIMSATVSFRKGKRASRNWADIHGTGGRCQMSQDLTNLTVVQNFPTQLAVDSLLQNFRKTQASQSPFITKRDVPESGWTSLEMVKLDDFMRSFVWDNDLPGASLAIAKNGRLLYARGFGFSDLSTMEPVEPEARFRIGAISQTITATAIYKLIEDGKLKLDDHPFQMLKLGSSQYGKSKPLNPELSKITIRQLLQHTSGFSNGSFPMFADSLFGIHRVAVELRVSSPPGPQEYLRAMAWRPLYSRPGQQYVFSNFGYCVLGRVIEHVTGQTYENYVREHMFSPLAITGMQIGRSRLEERADGEVRYYARPALKRPSVFANKNEEVLVPDQYGGWHHEAGDSAFGWIASASDLVRFASSLSSDAKLRVLEPTTVSTMFSPPEKPVWRDKNGTLNPYYFASGWLVRPIGDSGRMNTWNTGEMKGTYALLVRRSDGFVYAVFFNCDRDREGNGIRGIDSRLFQAIDGVKKWPNHDLFTMPPRSRDEMK